MDLLVSDVIELFYTGIWPMIRITAFLLAAPFFSLQAVTVRLRVLIAVALTILVYPLLDLEPIDPLSSQGFLALLGEIFIGVLLGVTLQMVSSALAIAGQSISATMGLGMANMIDPSFGNVPVLSQFLIICSTLIFMGLGGHIIILSLLTQTFYSLPIGTYGDIGALAAGFIEWSSLLFAGSLIIALPILLTLLFVNLGIGVITRAAPALNIFAVGFPAMIVAGLLLMIVSFSNIGYRIQWLWFEALAQVRLLGGLS